MARQWVKDELKKDFLKSFIEKVITYTKLHKETALISIIVAGIIIIITVITVNRFEKSDQLASEQIGFASLYLRAGQVDQTIQLCDQIIQTHPSGVQGGFAYFYKGESLYLKKSYEEAVKSYILAMPLLKKKEDLGAMILFSIANSYENSGKYQEAINSYKQLTEEYSAHYLVPESQIGMARCYETMGDIQSAISYYQTVGSLHPNTAYKNISDERLKVLEKPVINQK
ncbi:MAG: tetratricopeptide repeat protein [Elusimicrobia bacterium]|nr:tetratricopeptide repeat protein [Elusimicrobiota bacterium]